MKEHEFIAILKDLQKFLKTKSVRSEVHFKDEYWFIAAYCGPFSHDYLIFDGMICQRRSDEQIVSLADPKYREKFYEHFKRRYGHCSP